MKKLMLVRHAKSGWDIPDLTDFERPLNHRGEETAPEMAQRLLNKGIVPQYIVSSPAERAKATAQIFADTFKLAGPEYDMAIYEANTSALLSVVNKLPDEYNYIALFGHNPGISDLVYYLTDKMYEMPTCAVVVIHFNAVSWQYISDSTGTIEYYDYPKNV
ncbi:histidine phosphatase family protein [Mucilaginibacter sp. PPCGB 2223]|uniref:SixA phosphatase family protein n=1 Tax=Mucilaginibacter sp. PPCGB 2223 TaxID=1886027 RepID=UPI00082442EE|nr:histidine phosphatase family protein [Mucilaginibacter sp. PPCGB 2223]OCX54495.1 histidine phosphatase family protein [Mucilaginibacter sp. PPCGB 2223]